MRKVSVIAITATYLDMTFATTANITSVVETGGYFVHTVICTIIWESFPMSLVNDMKGELMSDLISRQAVLELPRNVQRSFFGEVISETVDVKAIEALPTIEPRKGKWLPDNNSVYEMRFVCSECNESQVVPTTGFTKYKPIWDFCPNCGADMREVTE